MIHLSWNCWGELLLEIYDGYQGDGKFRNFRRKAVRAELKSQGGIVNHRASSGDAKRPTRKRQEVQKFQEMEERLEGNSIFSVVLPPMPARIYT